jgi:S1-C subfamily serine protease
VGENVTLLIARGGEELTLGATTEEQDESSSSEMDCESWGFTARGITRELALEFSLPDQRGVFVAGVKPNGPAFQARLFPGDRIISVGDQEVPDLESLRTLYRVRDEAKTEKVLLTVMRRHSRRWILIEADHEN